MDDKSNFNLDEALIHIIRNQIKNYDPPETKQTYYRLIKEGLPEDETLREIVYVLTAELNNTLFEEGEVPFNKERYIKRLKDLPLKPK